MESAEDRNTSKEGTPTVWRFGLLAPTENAAEVRRQMRASVTYYNTLVQIEIGRRDAVRAAESSFGLLDAEKELEAAREALDAVERRIKSARSLSRKRSVDQAIYVDRQLAMDRLKLAKDAFRKARSSIKESSSDTLKSEVDRINACALELRKNAREHCGIYWHTYILVEEAFEAASKATPMWRGSKPSNPEWKRWNGEGSIGALITGGLPFTSLFAGESTVAQIVDGKPTERQKKNREEAGLPPMELPKRFKTLRVRVGSDGRSPVWAEFPMVVSRPFPIGAIIKNVRVNCRKIGPSEEWYVTFTLRVPSHSSFEDHGTGVVAVNFGWRKRGDALRVATYRGDDMKTAEEFLLNARAISGINHASNLASHRDDAFNDIKGELAAFLGSAQSLPPSMVGLSVSQWKSKDRLRSFVDWWKLNRFDGDDVIFKKCLGWAIHDLHLWDYESHQRSGAIRHRTHLYRCLGAELARRYKTLVIDDFDMSEAARLPSIDAPGDNRKARSNRVIAAPGDCRLALINAFVARGGIVMKAPAEKKTVTCNACRVEVDFDAAENLGATCACGAEWDQDANNVENLHFAYRAGECISTAKKSSQKWTERKKASSPQVAA